MDERIKGGMSLWDRITSDPKFLKVKHEIQARYGLPLNYDIRFHSREWSKWIGHDERPTSQTARRGQAFLRDVYALFKKFEVPEAWHNDFIAEIAGESISPTGEMSSSPKFEIYEDSEGNWKWRCIITPETDLTNPIHLEMIQSQQKKYAGNPPQPVKDKKHPRKLDFRPVYEWYKAHPLFTIEEIAKKIGYSPQRLRSTFSKLEEDK